MRIKLLLLSMFATSSVFAATLQEIKNDSISNDIKLQQTSMNIMIQSKNIEMVESQYRPVINLNSGINYGVNNNDNIPYKDQTTGSLNIGINYNVYDPTRDINLSIEKLKTLKTFQDNIIYKNDLEEKIAMIYFEILKTEKIIKVNKENIKAVNSQYKQISEMVNVGLKSSVDLKDVKANKDNVYAELISTENMLDNLKTELYTYTGKDYDKIDDVKFKEAKKDLVLKSEKYWKSEMLKNNPKITNALLDFNIAKKEIEQAESSDDLHVSLMGKLGTDYNNRFGSDKFGESANIGLNVSIPLYTGGYTKALEDQSKYKFVNSSLEIKQVQRILIPQLKRIINDLNSLTSKIKAYEETVKSTKSSLNATKAGFKVGSRTMVDVLNSNTKYFESKKNLYAAEYDYLAKEYQLENIVGSSQKIINKK